MFSIKNVTITECDECNDCNNNENENNKIIDIDNCIFSTNESRPSKSLIDCDKFKEFNKLDLKLEILDEYSYIKFQTKSIDYLLLRELITIFKLDESQYDNISLSFDTIIINENVKSSNLLFLFEKDVSIKTTIENLNQLIKEMNTDDSLIINFNYLFTYPSAELLVIITNLFEKVKIYYCKILKQNVLYCINYKHNNHITVFLKLVIKKWNKTFNIRQFGIYINQSILDKIKNHNIFIFDYHLDIKKNIMKSSLEDKEYFFKHYCKKYSKKSSVNGNYNNNCECNHNIKEFNLQNCFICDKCFEMFCIY